MYSVLGAYRRRVHTQRDDPEQEQHGGTHGGRTNMGSRGTGASSVGEDDRGAKPIHLRGFAPGGCPATANLQKHEAQKWYANFAETFDEELTDAMSPMQPPLINHSLAHRCSVDANIFDIAAKFGRTLAPSRKSLCDATP